MSSDTGFAARCRRLEEAAAQLADIGAIIGDEAKRMRAAMERFDQRRTKRRLA